MYVCTLETQEGKECTQIPTSPSLVGASNHLPRFSTLKCKYFISFKSSLSCFASVPLREVRNHPGAGCRWLLAGAQAGRRVGGGDVAQRAANSTPTAQEQSLCRELVLPGGTAKLLFVSGSVLVSTTSAELSKGRVVLQ